MAVPLLPCRWSIISIGCGKLRCVLTLNVSLHFFFRSWPCDDEDLRNDGRSVEPFYWIIFHSFFFSIHPEHPNEISIRITIMPLFVSSLSNTSMFETTRFFAMCLLGFQLKGSIPVGRLSRWIQIAESAAWYFLLDVLAPNCSAGRLQFGLSGIMALNYDAFTFGSFRVSCIWLV